jgi:hypothetical protein
MLTRHASLGRKSITLREQRHHVAKFPIADSVLLRTVLITRVTAH